MKQKVNWKAISKQNRHITIDWVQKVIDMNKGFLLNYHMFSDLQIALQIEIRKTHVLPLYQQLYSKLKMDEMDFIDIDPESNQLMIIFLNISFVKGKGKMLVKVPEVPG